MRGRPRLYCSSACRQRAYRKLRTVSPDEAAARGALIRHLRDLKEHVIRTKTAVTALEKLGWDVSLTRRFRKPLDISLLKALESIFGKGHVADDRLAYRCRTKLPAILF
jgi:hypothetical protein